MRNKICETFSLQFLCSVLTLEVLHSGLTDFSRWKFSIHVFCLFLWSILLNGQLIGSKGSCPYCLLFGNIPLSVSIDWCQGIFPIQDLVIIVRIFFLKGPIGCSLPTQARCVSCSFLLPWPKKVGGLGGSAALIFESIATTIVALLFICGFLLRDQLAVHLETIHFVL